VITPGNGGLCLFDVTHLRHREGPANTAVLMRGRLASPADSIASLASWAHGPCERAANVSRRASVTGVGGLCDGSLASA
jgi:hypothetical protein